MFIEFSNRFIGMKIYILIQIKIRNTLMWHEKHMYAHDFTIIVRRTWFGVNIIHVMNQDYFHPSNLMNFAIKINPLNCFLQSICFSMVSSTALIRYNLICHLWYKWLTLNSNYKLNKIVSWNWQFILFCLNIRWCIFITK